MAAGGSDELEGLKKIKLFSLLQIIGSVVFIVGFVALFVSLGTVGAPKGVVNPTPSLGAYIPTFILAGIGGIILLSSFVMLIKGLKILASVDKSFKTPSTIIKIGAIALVLGIVFLVIYVISPFLVTTLIGESGASGSLICVAGETTGICGTISTVASILGILAILCFILGAPLYAIGEIWGVFKVGSKYKNELVQVGSIVNIIIPVIGPVLIFVGMSDIIKKF